MPLVVSDFRDAINEFKTAVTYTEIKNPASIYLIDQAVLFLKEDTTIDDAGSA